MSKNEEVFSIFILKSSKTALSQAEVFLRNRGWQVASGTNLKEAIAFVIQKRPQFIMLSTDHPNKKIRVLPQLLAQTFPVIVIAFAEQQSSTSVRALTALNLKNSLFPPVSGPSIERFVKKLHFEEQRAREQQKDEPQKTRVAQSGQADDPNFSGPSFAPGEAKIADPQAESSAIAQLMKQMSDDDDSGPAYQGSAMGGTKKSNMAYVPTSQGQGHKARGGYFPTQLQKNENESFDQWAERMKQAAMASPSDFAATTGAEGGSFLPPHLQKNTNESFDDWGNRLKKRSRERSRSFLSIIDP